MFRKLVALANKTGTPLVTVSSGPPHFHGDTIPATGGAIILDMSGLKKIIRVDRPRQREAGCPPDCYPEGSFDRSSSLEPPRGPCFESS